MIIRLNESAKTDRSLLFPDEAGGLMTLVFKDGSSYQGVISPDGYASGYGIFKAANGDEYHGEFKYGQRSGDGRYKTNSFDYHGMFEEDERSGYGECHFVDKDIYRGFWRHDVYEGTGTLITSDYTYEGSFKNGHFDGEGILVYNNRMIFRGFFVNGRPDFGRLLHPDGCEKAGKWSIKDGKWILLK